MNHLSAAISHGCITGVVGSLDVSEVDVEELSMAVKAVEELGCKSSEAQKLLLTAKQVKKLRTAVASDSWVSITSILDESRDMLIADCAMPEFLLVQDEVDNRVMLSMLLAALESGGATGVVGDVDTSSVDLGALDRYVW